MESGKSKNEELDDDVPIGFTLKITLTLGRGVPDANTGIDAANHLIFAAHMLARWYGEKIVEPMRSR